MSHLKLNIGLTSKKIDKRRKGRREGKGEGKGKKREVRKNRHTDNESYPSERVP